MNIDQFIKEAQARCDAATDGPWRSRGMCIDGPEMAIYDEGGHGAEDADFIAHARQDLPAALEIIASLRAELATVTQERDNAMLKAREQ